MDITRLIPKLDFEILPNANTRKLSIVDGSDWKHLEDIQPYIEIKVPGSKKYVRNFFIKGSLNVFASDALELSSKREIDALCELPDGAYYVRVQICDGADFSEEKLVFRYQVLQKRIDKAILDNGVNNSNREMFRSIREYKDGMKASIRRGDALGAMGFYENINQVLKTI